MLYDTLHLQESLKFQVERHVASHRKLSGHNDFIFIGVTSSAFIPRFSLGLCCLVCCIGKGNFFPSDERGKCRRTAYFDEGRIYLTTVHLVFNEYTEAAR